MRFESIVVALVLLTSCKQPPSLQSQMVGSWHASMEIGTRASKDPIVRGFGKVFGSKPLQIAMEVTPTSIEVRRYSQVEDREVTQHAEYSVLDRERIELSTQAGKTIVRVSPNGCDDKGCLGVQFYPIDAASPAVSAMGYLFGCDDTSGKIECATLDGARNFFLGAPRAD